MPRQVLTGLQTEHVPSRSRPSDRFLTTVLMTDIVESTEHAAELGDGGWRDLVHLHHKLVRDALRRHGGREVDTAGDGFFAVFDAPAAAVQCALEVAQQVRELGIEIRAGIHVGEVEQVAGNVGGLSVPIAARITGHSGAGEVLVSSTVRDLAAGAGLRFEDRGARQLKGVPGEWRIYAAVPVAPKRQARDRSCPHLGRPRPRSSPIDAQPRSGEHARGLSGSVAPAWWRLPPLPSLRSSQRARCWGVHLRHPVLDQRAVRPGLRRALRRGAGAPGYRCRGRRGEVGGGGSGGGRPRAVGAALVPGRRLRLGTRGQRAVSPLALRPA